MGLKIRKDWLGAMVSLVFVGMKVKGIHIQLENVQGNDIAAIAIASHFSAQCKLCRLPPYMLLCNYFHFK